MLFAYDFTPQDGALEIACDDDERPTGPELEYINKLYAVATEHMVNIDEIISKLASGFTFDRIYKTDLAALRLGIAEMKYTDIAGPVAINAAVEIAKKYGTDKSGAFVNGILAKV